MVLLRLLIAFALAVALPLQGLAAATCMCKLHQAQQQGAASRNATADAGAASHEQLRERVSTAGHAAGGHASKPAKQHGACPKCAMTCCHASAPAPVALSKPQAAPAVGPICWTPRLLASWAEPVPDKPPRA